VAFHKASINIQKLLIFNIDWKVKVCKYLSFTVLSDSGNVGAKNIQFLAECFGTEKMWFKVKWSPVEITTSTVMPSVMTTDNERASKTLHTKITDLPDDVLLIILLRLEPRDMISLESSCSRMRRVVCIYNAYKLKLDRIFRSKRLNNYMLLSQQASQQKTKEEISHYYKLRLYRYIYRSRQVPINPSDDDYIRLYKTEKKKQELEDLVAENRKHLTHMSLKLIL